MSVPAPFIFTQGTQPLLISMPHVGTYVPPEINDRLTDAARLVPDTDWHIEILYAFAKEMGASIVQATHSRFVVDLNRPPNGESLYPGQATTGLCTDILFDGGPVYLPGQAPTAEEIEQRRQQYWQPYHDKVTEELARLKAQFPVVALWDAHSIRSVLPQFFEGKLPDFNIGTNSGKSCALALEERIAEIAAASSNFTSITNGRYKGGYITRHYGQPDQNVHAVQLEMAQSSYMDEGPAFAYDEVKAAQAQVPLKKMLQAVLDFTKSAQ
jgi:N-formylglutamate deformylase